MGKRYRVIVLALSLLALLAFGGCAAPASPAPAAAAPMATPMPYVDGESGYGYDMAGEYNEMSASYMKDEAPAAEMAMPEAAVAAPQEAPAGGNGFQAPLAGRKIIRDASISIETDAFDNNLKHIEDKINSLGGYIENSYMQGRKPEEWQQNGRSVSITARVPQESFEALIQDVQGTGKVIELSRGSSDVTMQYIDNESRLSTLKIQLARLEDILTKSEKLADILALESEIGRIRYEIESLTTTQRRYDQLVDYSTVNIHMMEVQEITYVVPANDLGSRISDAFISVVNGLVTFFEWFVVILVGAFPILVVAGIVLLIVFSIRRKLKKRKHAKWESVKSDDEAPKE